MNLAVKIDTGRGSYKADPKIATELGMFTNIAVAMGKYPKLIKLMQIEGAILCGGFLRDMFLGQEPNDIDIFFTSQTALDEALKLFGVCEDIYVTTIVDESVEYQLVHKNIYDSIEEIVDDFDFSPVQLAFDGQDIYFGKDTLSDLMSKKVSVNLITKPLDSLNRLVKYIKWDIQGAYTYILQLMLDKDPKIVLGTTFYEGDEAEVATIEDKPLPLTYDDIPF